MLGQSLAQSSPQRIKGRSPRFARDDGENGVVRRGLAPSEKIVKGKICGWTKAQPYLARLTGKGVKEARDDKIDRAGLQTEHGI